MNSPHERAWHEELINHLDWLRSVVRARCGDRQAVEDVLNDVMTDALAIANPQQTIRETGPWLYRLAIRKSLLFRRKCGRRNRAYRNKAALDQANNENESETNPLNFLLNEEQQLVVRNAMLRLNGRDAEILLLKYVHDWNYKQISEQLGIDYWKVVHRLRTARENLRKEFDSTIGTRNLIGTNHE